jgi:hypothetical protein
MEFLEEAALPASVRGPVEAWALAALAVICAGVDIPGDPFGFAFERALRPLSELRVERGDGGVFGHFR